MSTPFIIHAAKQTVNAKVLMPSIHQALRFSSGVRSSFMLSYVIIDPMATMPTDKLLPAPKAMIRKFHLNPSCEGKVSIVKNVSATWRSCDVVHVCAQHAIMHLCCEAHCKGEPIAKKILLRLCSCTFPNSFFSFSIQDVLAATARSSKQTLKMMVLESKQSTI